MSPMATFLLQLATSNDNLNRDRCSRMSPAVVGSFTEGLPVGWDSPIPPFRPHTLGTPVFAAEAQVRRLRDT